MEMKVTRVSVTGGSGYIGSLLVRKLLEKGHTFHATLGNLKDVSKVGLLKSLPNAGTNLLLFRADIYDPNEFRQHDSQSTEYKDTAEALLILAFDRGQLSDSSTLQAYFQCRQETMMESDSDLYLVSHAGHGLVSHPLMEMISHWHTLNQRP